MKTIIRNKVLGFFLVLQINVIYSSRQLHTIPSLFQIYQPHLKSLNREVLVTCILIFAHFFIPISVLDDQIYRQSTKRISLFLQMYKSCTQLVLCVVKDIQRPNRLFSLFIFHLPVTQAVAQWHLPASPYLLARAQSGHPRTAP